MNIAGIQYLFVRNACHTPDALTQDGALNSEERHSSQPVNISEENNGICHQIISGSMAPHACNAMAFRSALRTEIKPHAWRYAVSLAQCAGVQAKHIAFDASVGSTFQGYKILQSRLRIGNRAVDDAHSRAHIRFLRVAQGSVTKSIDEYAISASERAGLFRNQLEVFLPGALKGVGEFATFFFRYSRPVAHPCA